MLSQSIDMSATRRQGQNVRKWREAISDARTKIRGLEKTITYYREMEKKGEPWPEEEMAQVQLSRV